MNPSWLDRISAGLVAIGDLLLGWSLDLPRDGTLLILVLLTCGLLLLARRWLTPQERLQRCQADLRCLRQWRRAARQQKDVAALRRLDRTAAQVRWIQLRADLCVLAVVLLPLGGLATWGAARLEYLSVPSDRSLELTLQTPASSIGRLAHLVPDPGVTVESSWLARVEPDPAHTARGRAVWRVRFGPPRATPLRLTLRHAGESVEHEVRLDGRTYAPPAQSHSAEHLRLTTLDTPPYRFLGIVPGWSTVGLAPWVVAYLLLSLVLTPLAKRWTRTA